jgi:hypothetical protein
MSMSLIAAGEEWTCPTLIVSDDHNAHMPAGQDKK